MMTNSTDFAKLVSKFLTDYLPLQRCCSKNTILSYRDTLKLFLRFLKEVKQINPNSFFMKDFNRQVVTEFLNWYRSTGAGVSTANQRLAALKSFSEFAQFESIENISALQEISKIKSRRISQPYILFLTAPQVSALINLPDQNTRSGLRHRIILTLLYDSGCRVQELCDLSVGDVFISSVSTLHLHGKGRKQRTVVISQESANLIDHYLKTYRHGCVGTDPLIVNRTNDRITRDGVDYILKKYAAILRSQDSSFPQKVHCHMLRHSKAVHMLEAGINLVYIRDFLGHEDISTTMVYLKSDNRLKNEAINKMIPKLTADDFDIPNWSEDKELLNFLNSLK